MGPTAPAAASAMSLSTPKNHKVLAYFRTGCPVPVGKSSLRKPPNAPVLQQYRLRNKQAMLAKIFSTLVSSLKQLFLWAGSCTSRWPGKVSPNSSYPMESQQNPTFLLHTQVSMESYSSWHKGNSGIFSPNAVRWVVGWLSPGEETSYPMSQMHIKKSKSCAKHDWISIRVLKSNPSN